MRDVKSFKKALARSVKHVRDFYFPGHSHPKAIMTSYQAFSHTATVNCGGEFASPEWSKKCAETVLADREFKAVCAFDGATASLEYSVANDAYQVRIVW